MSDDTPDLAERAMRRRKREDLAMVLPAIGVLLLVSPFVDIFAKPQSLLGIPVPFLFVFLVWIGGIAVTMLLARRLTGPDEGRDRDGGD